MGRSTVWWLKHEPEDLISSLGSPTDLLFRHSCPTGAPSLLTTQCTSPASSTTPCHDVDPLAVGSLLTVNKALGLGQCGHGCEGGRGGVGVCVTGLFLFALSSGLFLSWREAAA